MASALLTDLPAIASATGSSALSSAAAGAAKGAALGTIIPGVGTTVGAVLGAAEATVLNLLGATSPDHSPFQNACVKALAALWLGGAAWAGEALAAASGQWGAVHIDGGRTAHLAELQAGFTAIGITDQNTINSVPGWWLHGAGAFNGGDVGGVFGQPVVAGNALDLIFGPTASHEASTLAASYLTAVAQSLKITLPPPNQYATIDSGRGVKNQTNPTVLSLTPPTVAGALQVFTAGLSGEGFDRKLFGIPVWLIAVVVFVGLFWGLRKLK